MGLKDKLANAKTTDWLTKDVSDLELKQIRDLALISSAIEIRRKYVISSAWTSIRNRTTLERKAFLELLIINGATALYSIARGKMEEGFSKRHIKSRRNLPAAPYFSHNSLTCFSHSTFCTSCLNRTDKGHSDIFLWH